MASLDGGEAVSWIPSMTDADFPPWFTDASIAYYCGDTAPGVYVSHVYDLGTVTPFSIRLFADFDAVLVGATDLTYPAAWIPTIPWIPTRGSPRFPDISLNIAFPTMARPGPNGRHGPGRMT